MDFVNEIGHFAQTQYASTKQRVPSPNDPVVAVALVLLLHATKTLVMSPLNALALRLGAKNMVKAEKFSTQLFNLLFHVYSTVFLWRLTTQRQWMGRHSSDVWRGIDTVQLQSADNIFFYVLQLGYHGQRLLECMLQWKTKEDFVEMAFHHTVTCILIVMSLHCNYLRIGMLVLFVHCISDISTCVAKICNNIDFKVGAVTGFVGVLVYWGYYRLYVFPTVVIRIAASHDPLNRTSEIVCVVLLCSLWVLHVYWYRIFLGMGYNLVRSKGKVVEDLQEDKSALDGGKKSEKKKANNSVNGTTTTKGAEQRRKKTPSPASPSDKGQ